MTGKSFHLVGFLVAIAATIVVGSEKSELSELYSTYEANVSHDLVVGERVPGDYLVFQRNFVKASKWFRIVEMEQTCYGDRDMKITQVRALDQKADDTGATASILNGGPGTSNVTLHFESLRGYGIDFIVQLYAI